jgi:DNA-binding NtrC family response regulator
MKHGTLLVIDDNAVILTAVKICLSSTFERIFTLTSPEKALATIEQERPAAILLDMNFSLGVNSGQEGMIWLSAIHRKFPDIPIVLMTAYADVKLAVRALKNGAADFVTKPWDNDELVRVLKDAIDKAGEVVPLEQLETEHVRKVLNKCDGNMKKAADLLGISRQTLYNKVAPSNSPKGGVKS